MSLLLRRLSSVIARCSSAVYVLSMRSRYVKYAEYEEQIHNEICLGCCSLYTEEHVYTVLYVCWYEERVKYVKCEEHMNEVCSV